jgi:ribosomal protein S18 acetylase RimI-like enzyme
MTVMEEMLPGTSDLLHDRHGHINVLTLVRTAAQLPNIFLRSIASPISQQDIDELQAMRIAAGLYYDRIPRWIQEVQQGSRHMFFVYLSNPLPYAVGQQQFLISQQQQAPTVPTIAYPVSAPTFNPNPSSASMAHPFQTAQLPLTLLQAPPAAVGMVCLLLHNPEDPSLASFSNSGRVEITSLFVFPAYRPLGVALAVLRAMEQRAAQMGALYVTLTTPAIDRSLLRYLNLGYQEYKQRAVVYSQAEVQSAGLGPEYTTGAFLEKRVS